SDFPDVFGYLNGPLAPCGAGGFCMRGLIFGGGGRMIAAISSGGLNVRKLINCCVLLGILGCALLARAEESYDVVAYGGTSGGVIAAVQAGRMGKSVVLIESGKHLGGMTT